MCPLENLLEELVMARRPVDLDDPIVMVDDISHIIPSGVQYTGGEGETSAQQLSTLVDEFQH